MMPNPGYNIRLYRIQHALMAESEVMQPVRGAIWHYFRKLSMHILFDSPIQKRNFRKRQSPRSEDICMKIFTAILFVRARS